MDWHKYAALRRKILVVVLPILFPTHVHISHIYDFTACTQLRYGKQSCIKPNNNQISCINRSLLQLQTAIKMGVMVVWSITPSSSQLCFPDEPNSASITEFSCFISWGSESYGIWRTPDAFPSSKTQKENVFHITIPSEHAVNTMYANTYDSK